MYCHKLYICLLLLNYPLTYTWSFLPLRFSLKITYTFIIFLVCTTRLKDLQTLIVFPTGHFVNKASYCNKIQFMLLQTQIFSKCAIFHYNNH